MTRKKITIIALSALLAAALIAGVFAAFHFLGGPKNPYGKTYTYDEAMAIYDSGDKIEGLAALRTVRGKKAADKRKEIYLSMFSEEFYQKVHDAKVGDFIVFGKIEQDDNDANGTEEITWRVLDKDKDGRLLLISEQALECVQYHKKSIDITWEESFVRQWLNDPFMKEIFTEYEQSVIPYTYVENKDNALYGTEAGNDTYDRLFLLSIDEAKEYFKSDRDRMTSATDKARLHYAYSDPFGNTAWWLRSPSFKSNKAAIVADTGAVYEGAFHKVTERYMSIRPAFWLDLA